MKKKKKSFFILAPLTLAVTIPFVAASCAAGGEFTGSLESMKPGTEPPKISIENFTIDSFFKNLKTKNPQNLTIDTWIADLNRELGNNLTNQFSFNRRSESDPIDTSRYLQISATRMKDIVNAKYLENENNSFNSSFSYDVRAFKVNENTVRVSISMYDQTKATDQLITQDFTLSFVFVEKEFHKLTTPIKTASDRLKELDRSKNIAEIKPHFDLLQQRVTEAQALVDQKSEVAADVQTAINNLTSALNSLNQANQQFINGNKFAPLQTEISNLETKIAAIDAKSSMVMSVKTNIDLSRTKIAEAKAYIQRNMPQDQELMMLIDSLVALGNNLDKSINDLTTQVESFISNLPTSFDLKDVQNPISVLPSTIKKENLELKTEQRLEGSTFEFTVTPFDEFGKVSISGTIEFGSINRTIPATALSIDFMQSRKSYDFLITRFQGAIDQIKKGTWPVTTVNTEVTRAKTLQEKITELLAETETETNREVLNDKVALFLWAEEYSKTSDKTKSLETVKAEFLNKDIGPMFSKLQYLTSPGATGRWAAIERIMRIFSYAQATKNSTAPSTPMPPDLTPYRDQKFVDFMKNWYKDYIEKYYTPTTQVTNGQWVLFEFFQPLRTIMSFLLLENEITDDLKTKTIQTLERFSKSISNYGSVPDTGSTAGTRLIDNVGHFQNNFFVRNWTNLFTKNLQSALNDAADYKKWFETLDFERFITTARLTTPVMVFNFINRIVLQNNLYNDLKTNNSNLGFDTTDFSNYVNWFTDKYMTQNITFANINGENGVILMRIVAAFYLSLASESTTQASFLTKLKDSELLKNRQKTDFTKLDSITSRAEKNVWEMTFLQ